MRPSSRKEACMGRQCPRAGRTHGVEADSPSRRFIQRQAGGPLVAVETQVLRRHRVEHDQDDVGRARRGQGTSLLSPLAHSTDAPLPRRQDHDEAGDHGEAETNQSSQADRMPLQNRDQSRREPQGQDQPGEAMNPGQTDHEGGKQRPRAQQPGRVPTGSPRSESQQDAKHASESQEDQQIGQRDQPDEVRLIW